VSWSAHRAALSMYEVYGSERAPTTCCRFWAGRFRSTNIPSRGGYAEPNEPSS
jgi:hypothetical protein